MSNLKTILITGATSGIGLETASYLFSKDYDLILVGRNEEKLKNVSFNNGNAKYFVSDLENTEDIYKIFDYCQKQEVILDGMIHAAGYAINMPIRSYKLEHAERQMKLNYYAFLELCKHFYSRKISREGSSIVALSSLASTTKLKGSVLYSSSKNALNTAVVVASKEFVRRNIRVNAIMPAYVDTRMNDGLADLINIREAQPMGLIPPVEIAKLIEFLISDQSRYITGAFIPVSAGMEY